MDASNVRALKQAYIFKDVPEPVLEVVAGAAEEMSVPAGETVLSATGTPDAMYVIKSGTVRVALEGGSPPMFFGTGETVGEVPLLDGEPAGAAATALERVDLLVIRKSKLADALAQHPQAGYELYRAIAKSLAGRLRRAVGMIAIAKEGR